MASRGTAPGIGIAPHRATLDLASSAARRRIDAGGAR